MIILKLLRPPNTDNKVNKLVMVFAFAPASRQISNDLASALRSAQGARSCPQTSSCIVTIPIAIGIWLRPTLYRDTAPVLVNSFVTGDNFAAPIKRVSRSGSNSTKLLLWMQKHAPPPSLRCCGASSTSLHRDSFLPKVPGLCPDAASVNAHRGRLAPSLKMFTEHFLYARPFYCRPLCLN